MNLIFEIAYLYGANIVIKDCNHRLKPERIDMLVMQEKKVTRAECRRLEVITFVRIKGPPVENVPLLMRDAGRLAGQMAEKKVKYTTAITSPVPACERVGEIIAESLSIPLHRDSAFAWSFNDFTNRDATYFEKFAEKALEVLLRELESDHNERAGVLVVGYESCLNAIFSCIVGHMTIDHDIMDDDTALDEVHHWLAVHQKARNTNDINALYVHFGKEDAHSYTPPTAYTLGV